MPSAVSLVLVAVYLEISILKINDTVMINRNYSQDSPRRIETFLSLSFQ